MTKPYYQHLGITVHAGDCLDVLAELPDASVHAVVTDPPYGLADHAPAMVAAALMAWATGDRRRVPSGRGGFMGNAWDSFVPPPAVWDECLRVLKPGGHLLAFAGPRTDDLMGLSIRMAGFEIRDSIAWLNAQGYPKSLNVSKAIDKAACRPRVGRAMPVPINGPVTEEALRWRGWGTALKPGHEPVVCARKPLQGTVVANLLSHGAGALNIDGCRVEGPAENARANKGGHPGYSGGSRVGLPYTGEQGRWPTNVVLTHAPLLDPATGEAVGDACADGCVDGCPVAELGDAARFFPVFRFEAKAPATERLSVDGVTHETVKPLALMRWLVRLVTPPGGTVLDPFLGSGTTAQAARVEGFRCVGIEREASYLPLIRARLDGDESDLFGGVVA